MFEKIRECMATSSPQAGPASMADDPCAFKLEWDQALQWWKVRPVLRLDTYSGLSESVWAVSCRDPKNNPPPTDKPSGVVVIYSTPHTTPHSNWRPWFADAGGVEIYHGYTPAIWRNKDVAGLYGQISKEVQVRGVKAQLQEVWRKPPPNRASWQVEGNLDVRIVQWSQEAPGGAVNGWMITVGRTAFSEAETLAMIDRMREM